MFRPFVYGQTYRINDYYARVYREDKTKIYPIRFFVKNFDYKIFGQGKTNIHLFGIDEGKIFILGADLKGRDIFSRILYGSRISLSIGIVGAGLALLIGLFLGGIAGYFGGEIDNIIMRFSEMFMMAPYFYLILALRASFPPNLSSTQIYLLIVVILSILGWAPVSRIIRGMALSLRETDFVYAARASGLGDFAIIRRHILPHTFSYVITAFVLDVPSYILGESALSLIGLGIQEPEASLGNLLSQAMGIVNIRLFPWILYPGLVILLVTICFNVLGSALRDAVDPKRKIL